MTLGHESMEAFLKETYLVQKLSTIQIATFLTKAGVQVSPYRIRQLMRRMKIERRGVAAPKFGPAFWKGVDWRKSDVEIADEKEVDPTTVRRWRERVGKKRLAR